MGYRDRDHSKASLTKRIRSIATRGKKLDRDIHETAVDCLAHASEHGDITMLTKLYQSMPNGSRRKAMATWAKDHAPIRFKEKEESFAMRKGWQADQFNLDAAEAVPFWEHTKERNPKPFDIDAAINSFVKRIAREKEKAPDKVPNRSAIEHKLHEALNSAV